jgi:hypothetical protein
MAVVVGSADCCAQGTATATATDAKLRWKFTKGKKYRLEMKQDMTQNMMMQNQPMETSNKTTTYMTWEVVDVDEAGTAAIESKVERMTMAMNTPMGQFDIDTDEKEDPPGMGAQIAASIRPMIGVTFSQNMDTRGKISDVVIPEGALAGMKNQMGGMGMSADQLKEMTSKVSPVFPEEDMEIGKSWNQVSESNSPVGTIEVDNTYKYEGTTTVGDELVHRIGIVTKMAFPAEPNEMGMMIKVTEQDTKGTLYFSQTKGQLMKSEVDQDMTMNITAAGHDIVQKMKQKVTATFTEVK